jgi:DNA-binding NarL/FixJ family response regulator
MFRDPHRKVRILVVDDHPIVRFGIRQAIGAEPDLTVCGEADSPTAALDAARQFVPDLAIVDLSLGPGGGIELVRRLHELAPGLAILVLSVHDEALFAERAIRAGARGYIMKGEAITGLVAAVHQILNGHVYVSSRMSQQFLEALGHDAPPLGGRLGGLTDRELEVFELIGRGVATAQIAERLDLSVKTVETYRANIKLKLNLKDAIDLVRHATSWVERL